MVVKGDFYEVREGVGIEGFDLYIYFKVGLRGQELGLVLAAGTEIPRPGTIFKVIKERMTLDDLLHVYRTFTTYMREDQAQELIDKLIEKLRIVGEEGLHIAPRRFF